MTIEAFNRALESIKTVLGEPRPDTSKEVGEVWVTSNGGSVVLVDETGTDDPKAPFVALVAMIGEEPNRKFNEWSVDESDSATLPHDAATAALAWLSDQTPGIDATIVRPEPPAPPVGKTKRKAIPKVVRFEVFKRDKFTCQYCGAKAPDVMLECDHITPHSLTQDNSILNLVTACHACNNGKSDKVLSDDSAIAKQHAQLSQLQERRDQLEMMMQWQRSLVSLDAETTTAIVEFFGEMVPGWNINTPECVSIIKKAMKKYSVADVMEIIRDVTSDHVVVEGVRATEESAKKATHAFFEELKYRKKRQEDPIGSSLAYIGGIVKARSYSWSVSRRAYCRDRLRGAFDEGVTIAELKRIAIESNSWSDWNDHMDSYLGGFRQSIADAEDGQ